MKTIKTIACGLIALAISASAAAQSNFSKTYETAGPANNWFVSVGGGISWVADGIFGGDNLGKVSPNVELTVGKWVTPTLGGRFGYAGVKNNANGEKFFNNLLHGDVLWNFTNQVCGYKADRLYNAIPYASAGLYMSGDTGYEFTGGLGLLNNFRLNDRLSIFADIRGNVLRAYQVGGNDYAGILYATAGLTVNLGKKLTFVPAAAAPVVDNSELEKALADAKKATEAANKQAADAAKALADAQTAVNDANKKAADAEQELAALKNKPANVVEKVANHIVSGPLTVFFAIGSSELAPMELRHLTFYLDAAVKNGKKEDLSFVLTGSADKFTGSSEVNERLCDARVTYVKNILINNYGIDESKITVKEHVYSEDKEHPEFFRAVIIEH